MHKKCKPVDGSAFRIPTKEQKCSFSCAIQNAPKGILFYAPGGIRCQLTSIFLFTSFQKYCVAPTRARLSLQVFATWLRLSNPHERAEMLFLLRNTKCPEGHPFLCAGRDSNTLVKYLEGHLFLCLYCTKLELILNRIPATRRARGDAIPPRVRIGVYCTSGALALLAQQT